MGACPDKQAGGGRILSAPDVRTPGGNPANAEDTREDTAQSTESPADLQAGLVVPLPDLAAVQALLRRLSGGSA